MNSINFSYISFQQNLVATVLSEQSAEGTVFIFPTEKSKSAAIREFQKKWQFSTTLFLTMEELKATLFAGNNPLLKEEKRTLAFYTCLTNEDKNALKINNYFQSIELAQNFFDLWEEFNEELVDDRIDEKSLSFHNLELQDWQFAMYRLLLNIKTHYLAHIHSKGFDDIVFLYKKHKIDFSHLYEYHRFVFVNQFYYTLLEKAIIHRAASLGKQVKIYYQLPRHLVDEKTLAIKDFNLSQLGDMRTQAIDIFECKSDFSMMTSFFETIEKKKLSNVIDAAASQNSFERFLNFATFNPGNSKRFNHTSILQYFAACNDLLNSLLWEPSRNKILIPLQYVFDAILNRIFFNTLVPENENKNMLYEKTIKVLSAMADANYKYLDLDLECLKTFPARSAEPVFRSLTKLVKQFKKITSINALVNFIDAPGGVDIRSLLSSREMQYSDVLDTFYHLLSDFKSAEDIGLVRDWGLFFPGGASPLRSYRIAAGLVKLFIEYMKPKRIRFNYQVGKRGRVQFTDLLDTRNLQYDRVAVLNVIEGQLPHPRQTPFLFTEGQRRFLHLKTYDDVVKREKYYFFRLLFSSAAAYLFTQKNIEKNIEPSSFLEEIKLYFPKEKVRVSQVPDLYYRSVYQQFFTSQSAYQTNSEQTRDASFFCLPLDIDRDFPKRQLNLTYYSLQDFLSNPFAFYIQWITGARPLEIKVDEEFSPSLVGNIVHDILSQLWNLLEESTAASIFGYDFYLDEALLQKAERIILERRQDYYYKIPHNHTLIYFNVIVKPVIEQGVRDFFNFLHNMRLSKAHLTVYPEKDYSTPEENRYKTLLDESTNPLNLQINIRGRADLRIEDRENDKYYIFDYKTGKYGVEQLILYELFYYLIERPELMPKVKSFIYHVMDGKGQEWRDFYRYSRKKNLSKEEIIESFKASILDALTVLHENGFAMPEKRAHLSILPEITRRDLYLSL